MNINEFLSKEKPISRFRVAMTFIAGMFCGTALTVLFMWSAVLV